MSVQSRSTYPQSVLTLSAEYGNGTDSVGSPALVGRLIRRLRIAHKRHDLVAIILLQQRIRAESAR